MGKKFELTTDSKVVFGRKLFRIRALVSFGDVEAGHVGGWVEKESNLSHDGDAWVYGNARVSGNAKVSGDACVSGDARVSGNAKVSGDAWVSGNARVSGNAKVSGDAWVYGNARVYGDAWVSGDACVSGNARVYGDACVSGKYDHIIIGPIGSRNDYTTFCRAKDGSTIVACGCFRGDIDEFETAVKETHGDNKHAKAYLAAIQFVRNVMNTEVSPDD